MVSGWLHQARLIGSLQALVYFVITRIVYNADLGVELKFPHYNEAAACKKSELFKSSDFLHNQIRISESDIRYPDPAGS